MASEHNNKSLTPLEVLQTKLLGVFDILRGTKILPRDYYVILFLLSLFKEKMITPENITDTSDIKIQIEEASKTSKSEKAGQYLKIYRSYEPIINVLGKKYLLSIMHFFNDLDHQILSDNYPVIFDSILFRITESIGRYGGEFIQPKELTRFICSLADLPENASVFNPFAGLASFGVNLGRGQDYFGQELNPKTWALGALRIMAYERTVGTKYVCDDSTLHWPDISEKYDLIVSNPPFGLPICSKYKAIKREFRNVEHFLVKKSVDSLADKGKFIAILPKRFLSLRIHEQRLKKYLIDKDLVDTIISFPGGLLANTGIPIIIFVISKNKKNPGKVRFIKADKFVKPSRTGEKVLNDFDLNVLIHGNKHDEDAIRIVNIRQIQDWDYNLNVHRYFLKAIVPGKHERLVKLKDILVHIRGKSKNLPEYGKFLRTKDLKDDKMRFELDISNIERLELSKIGMRQISKSCLLLAIRSQTLKPRFFEFKGEPIFTSQDILSFKVKEALVDKTFLINELHSDYVRSQLEAYRVETTMPYIRKDDLLEVQIKLPSLTEQKAKASGIQETQNSLEEELNKNAGALYNFFYPIDSSENIYFKRLVKYNFTNFSDKPKRDEFLALKHILGAPRQNIIDWADNLLAFFNQNLNHSVNRSFEEFYKFDIICALQEIKNAANFITDVLEQGESVLEMDESEVKIISLADINDKVSEISDIMFKFKLNKLLITGEKLNERGISGNMTKLETLFQSLLTNADKHGFDKKLDGNEVVIELTEVEEILFIEVRNNGKPFPKNYDRDQFITKYSTNDQSRGMGMGGHIIHKIATAFKNADWILSLNEDPIYPVIFKFKFPVEHI